MTGHTHDRGHRTTYARPFLFVAFLLQRFGDAAVIWFTFLPICPTSLLRGIAIGSAVWTTALLVGVWRRHAWARYLLTAFNWCYIAVFTFVMLQGWTKISGDAGDPYFALIGGVGAYIGANVILVRSRRVRHYANR